MGTTAGLNPLLNDHIAMTWDLNMWVQLHGEQVMGLLCFGAYCVSVPVV